MPTTFRSDDLYDKYYQYFLPSILKMAKSEMIPVNLDCPTVYRTAIAALQNVEPYIQDIEKLQYLDLQAVRDLKGLACALSHANSLYQAAKVSSNDLVKQVEEATSLSETLQADITALIRHHVVEPVAFPNAPASASYKVVAEGLQTRADYLKVNWPTIEGKCSIQPTEIDHGIELSALIQNTVAIRESGQDPESVASLVRQGLFTRAVYSYNELRRGVLYYRDHERDADTLAPSLYSVGRTVHHQSPSADTSNDSQNVQSPTPATQTTTTGTKKVPGGPGGNPFSE